jgi:hypothetical protein
MAMDDYRTLTPEAAVYFSAESIQGAYIRRDDRQAINHAARMRPDTLRRIGTLARYVLNIDFQLPTPDARL